MGGPSYPLSKFVTKTYAKLNYCFVDIFGHEYATRKKMDFAYGGSDFKNKQVGSHGTMRLNILTKQQIIMINHFFLNKF